MRNRLRYAAHATAFALVASLASTTPAHADDEAAATELFNAGRDLMKTGDFVAACPKLAESVRLKPTVGALAKLASCEEHERRLANARARWQQALNLARAVGDGRAAEVERELARIDAVVPKVTFESHAPLPEGAVIRLDDLPLGPASLGIALPVDPGVHRVVVSAPSKRAWASVVETLPNGATSKVLIPPLGDAPRTEPRAEAEGARPSVPAQIVATPAMAPEARRRDSPSAWRPVGLAALGGGVAAIGVGAVFGLVALNDRSAAHCAGTTCPDDASASKLSHAKTAADVSTALFAAGGALAIGGAVAWLTNLTNHGGGEKPETAIAITPFVSGSMLVGLNARGRF